MMLWRDHADAVLQDFDVVVTSGNEPHWWLPREDQSWVAYTHSTPRWMYDRYHEIDGWVARTVTQVRRWIYQQDLHGPDIWVANSDVVKQRMVRYYDLDPKMIEVVYPPINTEQLGPDVQETGDYLLSLGRLAEVKRIPEVIDVANEWGLDLRIAGTGPEEDKLRKQAGDTVSFEGWVTGERKRELLSGAKAVINASRNEDFGMVVVEAIASGTPVITVDEGMPQYTVLNGLTGLHYARGNLGDAIHWFDKNGVKWSEQQMAEFADRNFSREAFLQQIQGCIDAATEKNTISPSYRMPNQSREAIADD